MAHRYIVAIDMGGTVTRCATFEDESIIYQTSFFTTSGGKTPEELIQRLVTEIAVHREELDGRELAGVGILVPGPTNGEVVFTLPNVSGWEKPVALLKELQSRLDVPFFLENDANGGALGEYKFGGGQGTMEMVFVTISTGIGGGRITRGLLDRGTNGSAAEIGHMKLQWINGPKCNCGSTGCWEALASGTAIARYGRTLMIHDDFRDYLQGRNLTERQVTALIVADAARVGVLSACHVMDRVATAIGIGLANLANLCNPALIVLGGGVMNSSDLILETAKRTLREHALPINAQVQLAKAQLGEHAGLFGALALVQKELLED